MSSIRFGTVEGDADGVRVRISNGQRGIVLRFKRGFFSDAKAHMGDRGILAGVLNELSFVISELDAGRGQPE